jgi:hypothetical protein
MGSFHAIKTLVASVGKSGLEFSGIDQMTTASKDGSQGADDEAKGLRFIFKLKLIRLVIFN